ncbi:integrase [Caballeronia arationis]|nr:integrase [Caballeronia arationis]
MTDPRGSSSASPPEKLTAEQLTLERAYTTKDFTALRAYVQRIPPAVIARIYYDSDADPHAATPGAMERHLGKMLDTLVALAIAHGSSVLADHLRASIKQHGQPKLTAVTFRMVTEAAQLAALPPHPDHAIGALAAATRGAAIERRGDCDVGRAGRVLQPARRQLVALDSAHRPGSNGRHRRRLGRAGRRAASRGRTG